MEVLHQAVFLDTAAEAHRLRCSTTIWAAVSKQSSSIRLHARMIEVEAVSINGLAAEFRLVDPLRDLSRGDSPNYRGDLMDARYRAALEISRRGELEILIPEKIPDTVGSLPSIPSDAVKSVKSMHIHVQNKLNRIVTENILSEDENLSAENAGSHSQDNLQSNPTDLPSSLRSVSLVAIHIRYHVRKDLRPLLGIKVNDSFLCSVSGSNALDDVDGVRCWLPCRDCPSGRTSFDVTIVTSNAYHILCSGKQISVEHTCPHTKQCRFITDIEIPPFALGFFVGRAERYSYPLYRVRGSIWVIKENIQPSSNGSFTDGEDSEEELMELNLSSVRHSSLGLDFACRKVHKFVGRLFSTDTYTQVFIPNLGKDMHSYHGMSFIDCHFLHSTEQVYMETPAHLLQLQAYLYSWLKCSIWIDSFQSAFLIHGIVGYILNCYVEHVFGEDSGNYRFQKTYDTVISYERMGKGLPLVQDFPELFERYDPVFETFLFAKSTVIMHLIENKIGDRDIMRTSIMNIVNSPPLVNTHYARDRREGRDTIYLSKQRSYSLDSDVMQNSSYRPRDNDSGPPTPYLSLSATPFQSGGATPQVGSHTPFASASVEQSPWLHPPSPSHRPQVEKDKENFPIPRPLERAPSSVMVEIYEKDLISGAQFISEIRKIGGMAANIDEHFIEKYVRSSGIAILRTSSRVSGRDDHRLKLVHIDMEQLTLIRGEVVQPHSENLGTIQVRIFEANNEMKEGSVAFRAPNETYIHQIHIRRTYGPRPKHKAQGIMGAEGLTLSAEAESRR